MVVLKDKTGVLGPGLEIHVLKQATHCGHSVVFGFPKVNGHCTVLSLIVNVEELPVGSIAYL